jgi:hypothetical protein
MRRRLRLLAGQTIALGLAMAFLVVPASSILLTEYGARALPYTYLCVAVAGIAVSTMMARAQRRWSLSRVTVLVLGTYTGLVTAAWLALALAGATWVTFPLIVMFPLAIPIGFVLVGTQAGRLLDVRQMKAHFPRVAAGFPVGFAVGGLVAARLVGPLGGPVPLLGLASLAGLLFLAVAVVTARSYPDELSVPPAPPPDPGTVPAGPGTRDTRPKLRADRLVVLVFGYQVLSAVVTQLLDYMVWERAALRYPDPSDLARFLGLFGATINVVSVAFVVVLAGRLLTRYGIRFGLAANPAGVLLLLVASAATGAVAGPASTAFFVLVCAQQVVDISLTDGTTRTSINATYQALPAAMRTEAQTRVEGMGIPLSLGFVGLLLLAINAMDLDIVFLVVITAVFTGVWLWLALAAYREYRIDLQRTLTRREWDPVELRLDEESRGAIQALIDDGDLRDLRLGLDVLADTDSPDLARQVAGLLADPDPERRLAAVSTASRAARSALDNAWVAPALEPLREDPDERVRTAVDVALVGTVGSAERAAATRRWADVLASGDPARLPGALVAVAAVPDRAFVPGLIALAAAPSAPPELPDALSANAEFLADTVDAALGGPGDVAWPTVRRLIPALGESRSATGRAVLVRHIGHPDPEVADAVLDALLVGGPLPVDPEGVVRSSLGAEAQRASRFLAALEVLGGTAGAEHVVRGLTDELARSARRTIGLLCLRHDPTVIRRTAGQLGATDANRALALESLEVTVGRTAFPSVVALLDPALGPAERRARLAQVAPVEVPDDPELLLVELVKDPMEIWRDRWLRACALHALASVAPGRARWAARRFLGAPDPVTAETVAWVLATVRDAESDQAVGTP